EVHARDLGLDAGGLVDLLVVLLGSGGFVARRRPLRGGLGRLGDALLGLGDGLVHDRLLALLLALGGLLLVTDGRLGGDLLRLVDFALLRALVFAHRVSISIGVGCWAAWGCSGPA